MIAMIAAALLAQSAESCPVELVVLGVAQDAGIPQMGLDDDPAWDDASLRRLVVSLGVVDHVSGQRYLFEATPDIREQTHRLNAVADASGAPDGIFVTHAHMGHYTGLMFLGFESMGTSDLPVYTLPLLADFLTENGPWSQLVSYNNIQLPRMQAGDTVELTDRLSVEIFEVPHRREYAETAGFRIIGPEQTAIFIPDINGWDEWDDWGVRIEDYIEANDIAYLDATFFGDGEVPGRDMSTFPHPLISESMERFAPLSDEFRQRVRFIHFNRTNPVRFPDSAEQGIIRERGFRIAEEGERICL